MSGRYRLSCGIDRGVMWVLFRKEWGQITMSLARRNRLHRDFLIRSNENFQDEEQRLSGRRNKCFLLLNQLWMLTVQSFQMKNVRPSILDQRLAIREYCRE